MGEVIDPRNTARLVETTDEQGNPSGRKIWVRRLKSSDRVKLAEAAGLKPGDTASALRMGQYTAQLVIVDAEGLTDLETGKPVAYTREKHPRLGSIASVAVFDALTDEEFEELSKAAEGNGPLDKEQTKN